MGSQSRRKMRQITYFSAVLTVLEFFSYILAKNNIPRKSALKICIEKEDRKLLMRGDTQKGG